MVNLHDVFPSNGVAGTTVTLIGSSLSDATRVTFGAASAVFTINSSTQITTVVPVLTASSNTVTVFGSSGSVSIGFTVVFPGPWVQPNNRVIPTSYRIDGRALDTNPFGGHVDVVGTDPPIFSVGTEQGFTGRGLTEFEIGIDAADPLTYAYQARLCFFGVDFSFVSNDPDDRSIWMPAVFPTSAELAPADVFGYAWEDPLPPHHSTPGGFYAGGGFDLQLHSTDLFDGSYWVDDISPKTADVNADIWSARLQWRQFTAAAATWVGGGPTQVVAAGAWPTEFFGVLLAEHTFENDSTKLTLFSSGAPNNYVFLSDENEQTHKVHLHDEDLASGQKILIVFAFDRLTGHANYWTGPTIDLPPVFGFIPLQNGEWWKTAGAWGDVHMTWAYTPPRYRLLYVVPQIAILDGVPDSSGVRFDSANQPRPWMRAARTTHEQLIGPWITPPAGSVPNVNPQFFDWYPSSHSSVSWGGWHGRDMDFLTACETGAPSVMEAGDFDPAVGARADITGPDGDFDANGDFVVNASLGYTQGGIRMQFNVQDMLDLLDRIRPTWPADAVSIEYEFGGDEFPHVSWLTSDVTIVGTSWQVNPREGQVNTDFPPDNFYETGHPLAGTVQYRLCEPPHGSADLSDFSAGVDLAALPLLGEDTFPASLSQVYEPAIVVPQANVVAIGDAGKIEIAVDGKLVIDHDAPAHGSIAVDNPGYDEGWYFAVVPGILDDGHSHFEEPDIPGCIYTAHFTYQPTRYRFLYA